MDELSLTYLPFPHVFRGERRDGLTHSWPDRCKKCDRQCETSEEKGVGLCSYGVNFLRINEELLISGVVIREDDRSTQARSKMIRSAKRSIISRADIEAVLARANQLKFAREQEIDLAKMEILREYRESEGYKTELIGMLKPDLEQTFAQVHDYRQLTSQIIQNINVQLQLDFPDLKLDDQLDAAPQPIRSIYWAARLMEFKLESALFLVYPTRIHDERHKRSFRLHGAIRKYVEIYRSRMDSRGIRLRETGYSYGSLTANPDAVGVIPHAILDNAIKYAPDDSDIVLAFEESESEISISVTSLGPRIASTELDHLFELFYRGEGARASGEDGTGFGLGLAHYIATEINASLSARQDLKPSRPGFYSTTFEARFQKPSAEDRPPSVLRARVRTRGGVPYSN